MRALVPRAALVLLLAALSVLYQQGLWRYEPVDGKIIQNADFSQGDKYWFRPRGGDVQIDAIQHGAVLYRGGAAAVLPYVLQPIRGFAGYDNIRISAEIRVENLVPGKSLWQRAVLTLESFSRKGKMRHWPHNVANLSGGTGWQRVERILPLPKSAKSLRLVAFMGADQGRMTIRNITISAVSESGVSRWLEWFLIAAWLAVLIYCVGPLLLPRMITFGRILVMLTGLAILAATLAPQPQLSVFVHQARHLSGGHLTVARVWLESKLQYFDTDERPDPTAVKVSHPRINVDGKGAAPSGTGYVRRAVAPVVKQAAARGPVFDQAPGSEHLGHLSAYFILGAMVFTGYGRRKPGGAILALCLFAAATEALQSFVITRDAEWLDLMFNGMGLFVGVLTGYFALKISAAWLQIHSRSAIP